MAILTETRPPGRLKRMRRSLTDREQYHRRRYWALSCALTMLLSGICARPGLAIAAERSEVEIRIKAAFIYNFARFVTWPQSSSSGPVRIGTLGRGDLALPLQQVVQGKLAGGRTIEVTHIGGVAEADCCEMLLIEHSETGRVREIVQALNGKPVLTVCDCGDGLRDGAMIDFQVVDDSVRFQINQEVAERAGLRVSSQLLKVALPANWKRL